MMSFANLWNVTLAKLMSVLYMFLSVFMGGGIFRAELPKVPEDFTPVLRFAVCSDVHLTGDPGQDEAKRLEKLITFMNEYSDSQTYKGFDALCVAGDFANCGSDAEYDMFLQITSANLREGTQLLTCMGNHEFYSYTGTGDTAAAVRAYEAKFGSANTSVKINGYHFILCSFDEDGETFDDRLPWLDSEISAAVRDTGSKPVFVFQHMHPHATVYGCFHWGDSSLPLVFLKYPQIIDFSGHSHYPINDPRSMSQLGYTAFGCGTLSYLCGDLDTRQDYYPQPSHEAAQFYIVEADEAGNVRVMPYDLLTDSFFAEDYYLTGLAKRNFQYSYLKMKLRDKAPVFPEDASFSTALNGNGDTVLTFTGATDNFIVESYKLSLSQKLKTVYETSFGSKYPFLFEENVYTVNLGKLEAGQEYTVSIAAENAYAEISAPFCFSFIAE